MEFYYFSSGLLTENTYFLVNEKTREAVAIDAGENYKKVKDAEQNYNFKIKAELLTHAHFDHSGNAKLLQDDGVKIYIGKKDADKLSNGGSLGKNFQSLVADYTLKDGDILNLCGIKISVIETAGHTDGSLTFLVDDKLFTGDTLFLHDYGRTDLPTGNETDMINSLKKLFALKGDYTVYPGHHGITTLSNERNYFKL